MLQSIWFRAYYFLLIIIVIICKATVGLRVDAETEEEGLDLAEHGEKDYNL